MKADSIYLLQTYTVTMPIFPTAWRADIPKMFSFCAESTQQGCDRPIKEWGLVMRLLRQAGQIEVFAESRILQLIM